MPSSLPKNLSLCFSIIKRPHLSSSSPTHCNSTSTAAWQDPHRPSSSSSSQPSYLQTYNSLYQTQSPSFSDHSTDDDDEMPDAGGSTPDLATVYASHRFFFSSPGRSNSIVDSSSASEPESESAPAGGVAVRTYSPDPYVDFRRSMEEMVAARGWHDVRENWKSLHQLLLCYLSLNPKHTHRFIVAAFSDLIVSLMPLPPPKPEDGPARRPHFRLPPPGVGACRCSSR